jgi:FkbM family methyltransferase
MKILRRHDNEAPKLEAFEENLRRLEKLVLQEKSVDLVQIGPFMNLVYTDDAWYATHQEEYKRKTIYDLARHSKPDFGIPCTAEEFIASCRNAYEVDQLLIAYMAAEYGSLFTVCDIGIQYGSGCMVTALFLRRLGIANRIHAFDPGIAGALAPLNFENNGLAESIDFHPVAVGPVDGYVVLHRELGHSEDNRIVSPLYSRERGSIALPTRCCRLDTVLQNVDAARPAYIKVDTQGAEPGVWAGMSNLLAAHTVLATLEYVPQVIAAERDPVDFVLELLSTHTVFDVGINGSRVTGVDQNTVTNFADMILKTPERWTDLALIDRRHPRHNLICRQLSALQVSG